MSALTPLISYLHPRRASVLLLLMPDLPSPQSLGASVAAPAGSSSLVSQPAGGGDGDSGAPAAGAGADSELHYLEVTRQDRETSARLETLHRRLERLAEPVVRTTRCQGVSAENWSLCCGGQEACQRISFMSMFCLTGFYFVFIRLMAERLLKQGHYLSHQPCTPM